MNSREIIDGLVRGRKVDRVGLNEGFWSEVFTNWEDKIGDDIIQHFDLDIRCIGGWFDCLPKRGVKETVDESDEWIVCKDGAGASLKYWKNKSGTPQHIAFSMTNREIWEKDYRHHLLKLDMDRLDIEGAKRDLEACRKEGKWAFYGSLFLWEVMRNGLGDICMLESVLLDPDWIHDFNRVYTDFFKEHYKALIEKAGKPDGIWLYDDLGYKNGLFCSPKVLKELFMPYYKEIVDFLHSYDIPVILHSCGDVTRAMPLIAEAGFDGLNPMEVKAGCDIYKFAEDYGDQLTFFGGLDARILESGDKQLIKNETIKLIEGMKARNARFVFGSDHTVTSNV